jgi:acetyl esterase/lipase
MFAMNRFFFLFLIAPSICLFTSFCVPLDDSGTLSHAGKREMKKNIAYGSDRLQRLDLVLPRNRSSEKTPLVIFIHGGAWILGNKNYFRREIKQFADSGFACASINYRFVSNKKNIHHKEITSDVLQALEFLREHAKDWGFSSERIALVGHSAGGQLAMIIAYTQNTGNRIKAAVSWSGVEDFLDFAGDEAAKKSKIFSTYTGKELKTAADTALWKEASPYWNVRPGSVPTLLVQGDHDRIVPAPYALKMKSRMDSLGLKDKLLLLKNCGHIYFGKSWRSAKENTYSWLKMFL